ncbi:MAG: hypothetical protein U0872_09205 [Planctomycetaceae bacterium]
MSLSVTILTAGVTIVLAGYVSGGEAAWPLVAVLAGFAAATWWLDRHSVSPGAISIGVVGLFSLLLIGRYFGGLSTLGALGLFLTPLLCWLPEVCRCPARNSGNANGCDWPPSRSRWPSRWFSRSKPSTAMPPRMPIWLQGHSLEHQAPASYQATERGTFTPESR